MQLEQKQKMLNQKNRAENNCQPDNINIDENKGQRTLQAPLRKKHSIYRNLKSE